MDYDYVSAMERLENDLKMVIHIYIVRYMILYKKNIYETKVVK